MKKSLFVILTILLLWLQYRLWWGVGSYHEINIVSKQVAEYQLQIAKDKARNDSVKKDIQKLKTKSEALEEIAREQLGLIKKNEFFFRILH